MCIDQAENKYFSVLIRKRLSHHSLKISLAPAERKFSSGSGPARKIFELDLAQVFDRFHNDIVFGSIWRRWFSQGPGPGDFRKMSGIPGIANPKATSGINLSISSKLRHFHAIRAHYWIYRFLRWLELCIMCIIKLKVIK